MFKIQVKLGGMAITYTDSKVSINKDEIKEVLLTPSIIEALKKGILIKVN